MCAGQVKNAGGELGVAGASAHVVEVLHMTNVDRIVGLYPTVAIAAAGF